MWQIANRESHTWTHAFFRQRHRHFTTTEPCNAAYPKYKAHLVCVEIGQPKILEASTRHTAVPRDDWDEGWRGLEPGVDQEGIRRPGADSCKKSRGICLVAVAVAVVQFYFEVFAVVVVLFCFWFVNVVCMWPAPAARSSASRCSCLPEGRRLAHLLHVPLPMAIARLRRGSRRHSAFLPFESDPKLSIVAMARTERQPRIEFDSSLSINPSTWEMKEIYIVA